jgi:hypothetical protein
VSSPLIAENSTRATLSCQVTEPSTASFLITHTALSQVNFTKAGAVGYAGEGSLDQLQKSNLTEAVTPTTSPSTDSWDLVRLPELALASLCFNVG